MVSGRERPILIDDQFRKLNEIIDHPEPGKYDPDKFKDMATFKKLRNPDACFISSNKITRDNLVKHNISNPHLHQYFPDESEENIKNNTENWMFKLKSERRVPINLYDPVSNLDEKRDYEEYIPISQGIVEKKFNMADPGPGAYDPPLKDIKREFKSTEHNQYFTQNDSDRFGEMAIKYAALKNIPGPGN